MKTFVALLSLAFLATPAIAVADDTPAAAPPAPPGVHSEMSPAQRQAFSSAMRQMEAQTKTLLLQTRAEILNSLSPAHRALLANIVGQLAITPNPNPQAAARQLDAALSLGERNAVLSAHANLLSQARTMREQMRAQLESQFPDIPKHMGQPPTGFGAGASRPEPDAGTILLRLSRGEGMDHHFGPMMNMPPPPGAVLRP